MQLDDLKTAWAEHGAVLDRTLRVNEQLLREVLLRKVRFALVPYGVRLGLEIALGILTAVLAGSVWSAHLDDVRYFMVAGSVLAFAIALTALSTHLLVRVTRLDYGGPVTALQREVERIKLVAYRAFKWALLGGIVLWLPFALVLFEAVFGVRVLAGANLPWVIANIALGVLLFALGQALSRKYVEREDLRPWARRFVDRMSGRQLESATRFLATLSTFEREP